MSAVLAPAEWLEKKWQSRKWRGFVGLELAMILMAAAAWLYQDDPAAQQAVFATWADYAFKVFCAYIVGNVGAVAFGNLTVTTKEKAHGNPSAP